MLTPNDFHDYQKRAVNFQVQNPRSFLWLFMGAGKQQPNSEPVLTPTGWVPMGSLKRGDSVIGSQGTPVTVVERFPQIDRRVYQVTFNDGSSTRCGPDHLWTVTSPTQKRKGLWQTKTTLQLIASGLRDSAGNRKWHIPIVKPVQHQTANLPIEPYLLGVLLGDAHISKSGAASICTDREILKTFGALVKDHKTCEYVAYGSVKGLRPALRELGLSGARSWEKRVPRTYLTASVDQRLALLQGLLDTDGSPMTSGGVEFSSTSENLARSVKTLTESLGGIARMTGPRITHHQNGPGRPSWRVNVKLPTRFVPFRLARKLESWIAPSKYPPARLIESITYIGEENSSCILVDAPDHLYVTKDHIVTHNTPITLTSFAHLQRHGAVRAALVCGPLRVVQSVWEKEARKWEHLRHLRFSLIHGTPDQRMRALTRPADIYLINYEGLAWLSAQLQHYYINRGTLLPFDMLVLDESSKMKRVDTRRMEYMIPLLPYFPYRTGLTGTPASNGLVDLFGQFLVVDGGQRLGVNYNDYLSAYFTAEGYGGYRYTCSAEGEQFIHQAVSDIVLEMNQKDYLDLPEDIVNDVYVELPPKIRKGYDELERELFTELDNGVELEVANEGSKVNKCLQYSNGAVYTNTETREWHPVHDAKLDALDDIVEEASGQPVLVAYNYRPDAHRILKKFPFAKNVTGMSGDEFNRALDDWQSGRLRMLIGHPASMGHGVDGLQGHGRIEAWFGLTWNLEWYMQFNARLSRQGMGEHPVTCNRILTRDTADELQRISLEVKDGIQTDLRAAVGAYRARREGRLAA